MQSRMKYWSKLVWPQRPKRRELAMISLRFSLADLALEMTSAAAQALMKASFPTHSEVMKQLDSASNLSSLLRRSHSMSWLSWGKGRELKPIISLKMQMQRYTSFIELAICISLATSLSWLRDTMLPMALHTAYLFSSAFEDYSSLNRVGRVSSPPMQPRAPIRILPQLDSSISLMICEACRLTDPRVRLIFLAFSTRSSPLKILMTEGVSVTPLAMSLEMQQASVDLTMSSAQGLSSLGLESTMDLKKAGILPSLSKCLDFSSSSCRLFWEKLLPMMFRILLMVSMDFTLRSQLLLPRFSAICLVSCSRILALSAEHWPSFSLEMVSTMYSFSTSIFSLALSISRKQTVSGSERGSPAKTEPTHLRMASLMSLSLSNSLILFLRKLISLPQYLVLASICPAKVSLILLRVLTQTLCTLMLFARLSCSKTKSWTRSQAGKGWSRETSSRRQERRLYLFSTMLVFLSSSRMKETRVKVSLSLLMRMWLQIWMMRSRILEDSILSWSLNLLLLNTILMRFVISLIRLSATLRAEDFTRCRLNSSSMESLVSARSMEMSSMSSLKATKAISLTMLCYSTSLLPRSSTSSPSPMRSSRLWSNLASTDMQLSAALLTFQHFSSASAYSQYSCSSSYSSYNSMGSPAQPIMPSTLKLSSSVMYWLKGLGLASRRSLSSRLKVLTMQERAVSAASRMSQMGSMLSMSSLALKWLMISTRRRAVPFTQNRSYTLWVLMICVRQSRPFLSCFRLSREDLFLFFSMKRTRPQSFSLRRVLMRSLFRIFVSFPRQFSDFLMMSSLDLTSMFLRRQTMRLCLSNLSWEATMGHFLMNSVMMLIRMISTSVFLSLNSSSLEIDFRKRFSSLWPYCSAAWWITVAAHAPYLSLFFSWRLRLMMYSRIFSKMISTCPLGSLGTMSARYLMASDWTVSFQDSICFMQAYRTCVAVLSSASRLIQPARMSSLSRLAAISMLSGSQ